MTIEVTGEPPRQPVWIMMNIEASDAQADRDVTAGERYPREPAAAPPGFWAELDADRDGCSRSRWPNRQQ